MNTPQFHAPDPVVFECDLDAPAATVWRALTEPELLATWLLPDHAQAQAGDCSRRESQDAESSPRQGTACPAVNWELEAAEPYRLLRYRWRDPQDMPGHPGNGRTVESTVTFELRPTRDGRTHLRLTQNNFTVTALAPYPNVHRMAFERRGMRSRRSRRTSSVSLPWRCAA